jgi:N-acetyl-anhydromuramyl-L-alanine amidase AmpD
MNITKSILTKNPCYKAGKTIKVKGLMLHSVGCPQPSATAFINSWNTPSAKVCVHGFIDGNTGGVYQTLPWNHRGWHCGSTANGTHIGIEMCEPDCIKYTSGAKFTCSDKEKAKAVVERTYKSAVELFAYLCKEYDLNPLSDGVILAHSEGYVKGVASNHADPEHLWKGLKLPYTMDGFRQDVKSAMNPVIYRVQVGAFSKEQNAKNLLTQLKQKGFEGFIIKS